MKDYFNTNYPSIDLLRKKQNVAYLNLLLSMLMVVVTTKLA